MSKLSRERRNIQKRMKKDSHRRNSEVYPAFHLFPYRHGDSLPSGFTFNSWFRLSGYSTGVIADFHYPQKITGIDACGNCEGTGMLMRIELYSNTLEERECGLCLGTGSHEIWIQRDNDRLAKFDQEEWNIRHGRTRDGVRMPRDRGKCWFCWGSGIKYHAYVRGDFERTWTTECMWCNGSGRWTQPR